MSPDVRQTTVSFLSELEFPEFHNSVKVFSLYEQYLGWKTQYLGRIEKVPGTGSPVEYR